MRVEKTKGKNNIIINQSRRWSDLSYAGEDRLPIGLDPDAGSWPLFYIKRREDGKFTTLNGDMISFQITHPNNIDFDEELQVVKDTLNNLTPHEKEIAEYWGDGPATKQWTPIIDRLLDAYNLSPAFAARVLASVQAGINDAFVVTWYFKYLWDVARPNQLDQKLTTFICTPKFPTYPSGHSVVSGVAEVVLSYFFPLEVEKLRVYAEEDSISRLYAGVHFPSDISEGLQLGRQIGEIVVDVLQGQHDNNQSTIDRIIREDIGVVLNPPPYEQIIPYPSRTRMCNQLLLSQDIENSDITKPIDILKIMI